MGTTLTNKPFVMSENGTEISASLVTGASNRLWLRPLALPKTQAVNRGLNAVYHDE